MSDYLPAGDTAFRAWLTNFQAYAAAHLAELGLIAPDLAPITSGQIAFNTTLDAHVSATAAAKAATEAKDTARTTIDSNVRKLVRRLQASPHVTNVQREALGIPVRSPSTAQSASQYPQSRPQATIAQIQRLRHVLKITDAAMPNSTAKPPGAAACEIWYAIADHDEPTPDLSALRLLARHTGRGAYIAQFQPADATRTAYYALRWINTQRDPGPWSDMASATIAA